MPQNGTAEQPKFSFAGQEFENREAAERWASQQWETKDREAREAQAQLQAMQAMRQQPAPTQFVTGKESASWDHSKWLNRLAEDPTAIDQVLKFRLFGDANAPQDPMELMKASWAETARLRNEMMVMNLKANHPEIPWNDPRAIQLIEQTKNTGGGSYEGAIAILQRDGQLPTRQQWQATVSQPVTQGGTVQQMSNFQASGQTVTAPPPMGRPSGTAPSTGGLDINAILAKMADPATSLEESERLQQALINYANQNPTAGGL